MSRIHSTIEATNVIYNSDRMIKERAFLCIKHLQPVRSTLEKGNNMIDLDTRNKHYI